MSFVGKFLGREEMDQKYTLPSPSEVFIVLNAQDKKEAVNAMLKGKNQKLCTATDGKLTVVKPSGSKKPGQRTRPRANRTESTPKRKRTE